MCVYGIAVTVYRVVVFPSLVEIVSLETRVLGRFFCSSSFSPSNMVVVSLLLSTGGVGKCARLCVCSCSF